LSPAPDQSEILLYAERAAAAIGLPLDPARKAAVAQQLGVMLTAAALVLEFPLPDEVEAAPVFEP
jgi:1-carboxybiuret hydrolase subunit AtzG-like protein